MSITAAVPSVFVINLDRARDRLTQFRENMAVLEMPFLRWRATAGDELNSSQFGIEPNMEGVFITGFREWSKNEAACGVSHITLMQHLVRERIPWTIIMEDDAVPRRKLPVSLSEWELPDDAEIVLLNDRATVDVLSHRGNTFSYGRVTGGAGTEGYLISLAGARKLLQILYPFRDPLDFQMYSHFVSIQEVDSTPFYWRLPQNPSARNVLLNAYRVVPALVGHAGSVSTIGGQRHPRARYYCKVLLGLDLAELHPYTYIAPLSNNSSCGNIHISKAFEYRAVDVSHLDESMSYSAADGAPPSAPMTILYDHGVNCVRISLWVDPQSKMNLHRALHLARLARTAGLRIYLVLHYSDHWADPSQQTKPAAWSHLPFDSLCARVYEYTKNIVEAMAGQGTPPAIVQLGNEITNGFLWASSDEARACGGRLSQYDESVNQRAYDEQWPVFATIVRHATRGVREANLQPEGPKVMLQIDKGAQPEVAAWWFDKARAHGLDFDMIGLSYYFLWHHATVDELSRMACLSAAFPDKEIMLAETAYPYRWAEGITMEPPASNPPFTFDGQAEYLAEVLRAMRALPNGVGLCWWGAFFLNASYDPCKDLFRAQALFDARGVAVPALSAFRSECAGGGL